MNHRKHHFENVLNSLFIKYDIEISYVNRQRICNIFKLIDEVISQFNEGRKWMISVNHILREILKMLGLPYENIKTSTH